MSRLRIKHLTTDHDLYKEDIEEIFATTIDLKGKALVHEDYEPLRNRTVVLIFEKPSLRTRLTFEVAIAQLGGRAIFLKAYPRDGADLHLAEGVEDQAEVISRIADAIVMRTFEHRRVEEMAHFAGDATPVINGLSDDVHPCQALTDFYTILEEKGRLSGLELAYVGDGRANTAHSLLLLSARMGVNIRIGCPPDSKYTPKEQYLDWAREDAKKSGSNIQVVHDPIQACRGADVIYTDTWVSMGREEEKEERLKIFPPYQVNQKLVEVADDDVMVLHCLPAYRGLEITSEVMKSPNSRIMEQAGNRLHVQKAILTLLLS